MKKLQPQPGEDNPYLLALIGIALPLTIILALHALA